MFGLKTGMLLPWRGVVGGEPLGTVTEARCDHNVTMAVMG